MSESISVNNMFWSCDAKSLADMISPDRGEGRICERYVIPVGSSVPSLVIFSLSLLSELLPSWVMLLQRSLS